LKIYDPTGRLVACPIKGAQPAGFHQVSWLPKANAGVYFYFLDTPWEKKSGKVVLLP
jgi:hypothetical protein